MNDGRHFPPGSTFLEVDRQLATDNDNYRVTSVSAVIQALPIQPDFQPPTIGRQHRRYRRVVY